MLVVLECVVSPFQLKMLNAQVQFWSHVFIYLILFLDDAELFPVQCPCHVDKTPALLRSKPRSQETTQFKQLQSSLSLHAEHTKPHLW